MLEYIRNIAKRRNEETGATAVEYGLLVALIAAVIVVIVSGSRRHPEGGLHGHLHRDLEGSNASPRPASRTGERGSRHGRDPLSLNRIGSR